MNQSINQSINAGSEINFFHAGAKSVLNKMFGYQGAKFSGKKMEKKRSAPTVRRRVRGTLRNNMTTKIRASCSLQIITVVEEIRRGFLP